MNTTLRLRWERNAWLIRSAVGVDGLHPSRTRANDLTRVVLFWFLHHCSLPQSDDDSGDEDLIPFERVVKADSYKRALNFDKQLERYEATEDRLVAITDQMKLWVKNTSTEYKAAAESQTFVVTVFPQTPIKELRVREQGAE